MKNTKKDKPVKPTARPVFNEEVDPDVDDSIKEVIENGKVVVYSNMSFDDFEKSDQAKKAANRPDKIFDNTYNTGNTETQKLPDIHINGDYASSRLEDCYDSEQYAIKKDLLAKVYEIYKVSQWKDMPNDKKFPKELAPFIFQELWAGLAGNAHSATDMFIAIAEFMDTSYEKVYEAAGLKVKEQIIRELETKYKLLNRKKINRLF